jgi:hypothetical protein
VPACGPGRVIVVMEHHNGLVCSHVCTLQYVLALPKGLSPTLSIVGFVFEEQPRPPPAKPAQPAKAPAAGPAQPPPRKASPADSQDGMQQHRDQEGTAARGKAQADDRDNGGVRDQALAVGMEINRASRGGTEESEEPVDEEDAAAQRRRRQAGPAMPSAEMLAAAAAAAAEWEEGKVEDVSDDDDQGPRRPAQAEDDEFMVGPPPPEMVEEMDAAPEDTREAEVGVGPAQRGSMPLYHGCTACVEPCRCLTSSDKPSSSVQRLCCIGPCCRWSVSCGCSRRPRRYMLQLPKGKRGR